MPVPSDVHYRMKKILPALYASFMILGICMAFSGCLTDGESSLPQVYADVEVTSFGCADVSVRIEIADLPDAEYVPFAFYPPLFSSRATLPVTDEDFALACPDGFVGGEVTDLRVSGDAAAFVQDGEILRVYPSSKDGALSFCFDYSLRLPLNEMRYGCDDFAMRLADFLPRLCLFRGGFREDRYAPIGDPFAFDTADYRVRVSYSDEFTLAAPGEVAAIEGGATIYLPSARDFTLVLLRDPHSATASDDGFAVTAYAADSAAARSAADSALAAAAYFRKNIGEPIRGALTVVVLPFYSGGMEYCGLVYVSDALSAAETASCVVHETAHLWWYDSVGFDQVNEPWRDETLAQVCTFAYFCDALPPYGYTLVEAATVGGANAGNARRPLSQFESTRDYTTSIYCKESARLYSLRATEGDEKFFGDLASLFAEHRGSICPAG